MAKWCDDCQREITTKCGNCHCDGNEDYCSICEPNSPYFKSIEIDRKEEILFRIKIITLLDYAEMMVHAINTGNIVDVEKAKGNIVEFLVKDREWRTGK